MQGLRRLQSLSWDEIFATWKQQEGTNPDWQRVAIQNGWGSWDEWRSNSVAHMDAKNRSWTAYEIENPSAYIPQIYIGPYKSWQVHFDTKLEHTFTDLVEQILIGYEKRLHITQLISFPQKHK